MNTISTFSEPADDVVESAINNSDKYKNRYESILQQMEDYIKESEFTDKVYINDILLSHALLDYFEDIRRLKKFHDSIEHIHSTKIVSYLVYWLLRRKPIQVLTCDESIWDINERFAMVFILNFLSDDLGDSPDTSNTGMPLKGHPLLCDKAGINAFAESMLYFFKYRHFDAQSIEMLILAFFAGQIYQETSRDISSFLPPSDYTQRMKKDLS